MKVVTAIGRMALRARLTVAGCGALVLLGAISLSACSPSGGTSTPAVSSFTITAAVTTASTTESVSPNSGGSTTVTVTPTLTSTVTVTPSPSPSPSPIPYYAPVTGGGGTAGFQDGLLLVLGAAAIVAGAGGIAYRRRLNRNR
jgi:hypothetical protein